MIKMFTRAELLREWLTRRGYQPLRSDVEIDLTTGTDLEAHMRREVVDWVREIYADAPADYLPQTDDPTGATLTFVDAPVGACRLRLPADAARVISLRLDGWSRPVAPMPLPSPRDIAASNPFLQPDADNPLAVMEPDGSILLRPASTDSRVASLLYIPAPPADDEPVAIDPILLTHIKPFT